LGFKANPLISVWNSLETLFLRYLFILCNFSLYFHSFGIELWNLLRVLVILLEREQLCSWWFAVILFHWKKNVNDGFFLKLLVLVLEEVKSCLISVVS
jgi:hypothetical protein